MEKRIFRLSVSTDQPVWDEINALVAQGWDEDRSRAAERLIRLGLACVHVFQHDAEIVATQPKQLPQRKSVAGTH